MGVRAEEMEVEEMGLGMEVRMAMVVQMEMGVGMGVGMRMEMVEAGTEVVMEMAIPTIRETMDGILPALELMPPEEVWMGVRL
jgi:hypothetical protein